MTATPILSSFRRIVVKVGSSLLVDHQQGALKRVWLEALADDLADLHAKGCDVLVVSSGVDRARPHRAETAEGRPQARRQPGGCGCGPDLARAHLVGGAGRGAP